EHALPGRPRLTRGHHARGHRTSGAPVPAGGDRRGARPLRRAAHRRPGRRRAGGQGRRRGRRADDPRRADDQRHAPRRRPSEPAPRRRPRRSTRGRGRPVPRAAHPAGGGV
ncbi:MAG: Aspartyl-tRNA(Asn) amidotransferase subunit C @ Glutamyl-tRNA(Gln) amidotransferase subunit C, partial [uncultured Blastococcus sp.]